MTMRGKILGMMFAAGLLVGCAHKVPMQTSQQIPAAQANVKVNKGDAGNSIVKLDVKHLAPPEKLVPGAKHFVVWVQPSNGTVQNVGAFDVGEDRKATFETKTPHKDFSVFVTAEPEMTATMPSSERLLFATVKE